MKPFIFGSLFVQAQQARRGRGIAVSVQRRREQGRALFEIRVSGLARATPQACWQVLTGYERLQEFVPGLSSSKLLSRNGPQAILEQEGVIGFLWRRQAIHLVVRVIEQPLAALDISLIAGDMRHYASHWELAPSDQGRATRISYFGSMEPDFFVPPLLGSAIMRGEVRKMMTAVIAEIDRRCAA